MPFIELPTDEMMKAVRRSEDKIVNALYGEEASIKAHACLMVTVAIWYLGGVTKEQAKKVAFAAIDALIDAREN